ncbi:hypothetical protein Tco_0438029 [Tanacetum coccineum]
MTTLKFAYTHNMVAFLSKPAESDGFEQIVDFLNAQPIRYALTVNPTIYISCIEQFWSIGVVKTINGEVNLHALVDGKKIIISEASMRRDLKLEDEDGIDCLPNSTIFEELTRMGKPKRKDTQVPQPSDPSDNVADKAVHKELGDSLVVVPGAKKPWGILLLKLANEIASLKKRVKKLEKKRSSRTHKLKRLYKDGLTARVEPSGDEEDLGEDASKQGRRINAIDADEDLTLVNVQDDADNEMFDMDALNGEEVFVVGQNKNVVEKVVDAAQVSTAATTVTITTKEITLAQALEALETSKPRDKGKRIMIEERVKPIKKKDQISFDEEVALKLQAEFNEEERLAREKVKNEKEANIALIEE